MNLLFLFYTYEQYRKSYTIKVDVLRTYQFWGFCKSRKSDFCGKMITCSSLQLEHVDQFYTVLFRRLILVKTRKVFVFTLFILKKIKIGVATITIKDKIRILSNRSSLKNKPLLPLLKSKISQCFITKIDHNFQLYFHLNTSNKWSYLENTAVYTFKVGKLK